MKIKRFNDILNEGISDLLTGYTVSDFIKMLDNLKTDDEKYNFLNKLIDKYPDVFNDLIEQYNIEKIDINTLNYNDSKYKFIFKLYDKNPEKFKQIINKTENQEIRDEYFNLYIFLEYDEYKEIEIKGDIYHKKSWNFENLINIDIYKKSDIAMIGGIKTRSKFQQGTTPYGVFIPKDFLGKRSYTDISELSDFEKQYIQENKFKL